MNCGCRHPECTECYPCARATYERSTDPVPRLVPRPTGDAVIDAAAKRVVNAAFDTIRIEAERHGFDAEWVEGLENLRDASVAAPSEPALDPSRIRAAGRADLGLHPVPTIAEEQRKAWVTPIAGTPSTMLAAALAHIQRARDLMTSALGNNWRDSGGAARLHLNRAEAFVEAWRVAAVQKEGGCHHGRFLCSECHVNKPEAKP